MVNDQRCPLSLAELVARAVDPALDAWIVDALAQSDAATPTELAERLGLPRDLIVARLVSMAECGLIEESSPAGLTTDATEPAATQTDDLTEEAP
jgi:DNA-binding IclR family transcriptional regulator